MVLVPSGKVNSPALAWKELVVKRVGCMILFCILVAFDANAALMCKDGIVSEGDHKSALLAKCGSPSSKSERDVVSGSSSDFTTIHVEEWTYIIDKVIRLVKIQNGVVVSIEWAGRL
jgi:hypothetical protein